MRLDVLMCLVNTSDRSDFERQDKKKMAIRINTIYTKIVVNQCSVFTISWLELSFMPDGSILDVCEYSR